MLNRNTIKNLFISLVVMALASVLILFAVSALTYLFKWQAPQAMIGITLTYILTGLAGGVLLGILNGPVELRARVVHGLILGSAYMLILLRLSATIVENAGWDYMRMIMIWILLVCSSVLGSFIPNIFCKKP